MVAHRDCRRRGWNPAGAGRRRDDRLAAATAEHRARIKQLVAGEPRAAFQALDELVDGHLAARPEELRSLWRQRETPRDVLERGLGGLRGERRVHALLAAVETALPWVEEAPQDLALVASLAWALDFGPEGADPADRERALRRRVLEPLRRLRAPPDTPAAGDPDWIEIPLPAAGHRAPGAVRMLRHQVTNAEYRRFDPDHPGDDDLPAAADWYQAYAYTAWLGGRLSTEAEWELAARADCAHDYCTREGWGTTVDAVAWTVRNSRHPETGEPLPQAVMNLEPNPWGLHDMLGNMWEWTADWYRENAADGHPPWNGKGLAFRGGCYRFKVDLSQPPTVTHSPPATTMPTSASG